MTDDIPARIRALPRARGYPVPWFVAYIDGVPDFRVMDQLKLVRAVREHRCWICGQPLGRYIAFVVGPMCAINRISSEPPEHRDCAEYSARVCPFLTQPRMVRRESHLPAVEAPAGIMNRRNPGVTLVWVTEAYRLERVSANVSLNAQGGVLFKMGRPTSVSWWAEGRAATRAEVQRSIDTGLPGVRELAALDGPDAGRELDAAVVVASALLPNE